MVYINNEGWMIYGAEESIVIGLTPLSIEVSEDEIHMIFSNGSEAKWYHEQDCCESVSINDVNGNWDDLIGQPLLVCECRTNSLDDIPVEYDYDSFTWTFYAFRGIGGSVDVRWIGESNGYYSEGVDFAYKAAP